MHIHDFFKFTLDSDQHVKNCFMSKHIRYFSYKSFCCKLKLKEENHFGKPTSWADLSVISK